MSLILVITNTTQLAAVSDYNYRVLVGDGTVERSTTIAAGKITGHPRKEGWKVLVQRLLTESPPDDWPAKAGAAAESAATSRSDPPTFTELRESIQQDREW